MKRGSAVGRWNRWNRTPANALVGLAALVAAFTIDVIGSRSASAADLLVNTDQATIHKLRTDASAIIVGNPSIADVNVQRGNMLVVLGKSTGTTNIIALDRDGEKIDEVIVHVRQSGTRSVTLYLGSGRHSFNCAPRCDRTLNSGDQKDGFETLESQITKKQSISQETASTSSEGE